MGSDDSQQADDAVADTSTTHEDHVDIEVEAGMDAEGKPRVLVRVRQGPGKTWRDHLLSPDYARIVAQTLLRKADDAERPRPAR
jgi:hypothetical protein